MTFIMVVQGMYWGSLKSKAVSSLYRLQSSTYLCYLRKRMCATQTGHLCVKQRSTKGSKCLGTYQTHALNFSRSNFENWTNTAPSRHVAARKYNTVDTERSGIDKGLETTSSQPEFTPIYRFPYIVQARMVSRFKVYHTIFTFTLIPVAVYLYSTGVAPISSIYMFTGVFAFAGVMLVVISSLIRKIVGALYIDRKKETVKLSHLTFWSRRKDEYYKISELVPLSDTNEQMSELFVKLSTYKGESYYLTLKHGKVLEKEDFMDVLGIYKLT